MTFHPHVTGVILAGGRATRMGGRDKPYIPLDEAGDAAIDRVLGVLASRCVAILVVTRPGSMVRVRAAVPIAFDEFEGCGPLGGLHAGLRTVETPLAFVCGADMPSLSGPLIDLLVERARGDRPLVPVRNGRPEPLHAVYPAACHPAVEKALKEGVRMMLDFFATIEVDYLPEEEYAGIEGASLSFENINTPEDLARVRRREPEA